MNLIEEAKQYMAHEIAPTLSPSIRGLFRARVMGLYRRHAEISVSLVNHRREVLQHFGKQVVPLGGAVIIDHLSSVLRITPAAPPQKAYFQAWLIGINEAHTEAEIALRLVDDNHRQLLSFGSATRGINGTITLEGLEITTTIIKRH